MNSTNDSPGAVSDVDGVVELFHRIADRVSDTLGSNSDWSWSGERDAQYRRQDSLQHREPDRGPLGRAEPAVDGPARCTLIATSG